MPLTPTNATIHGTAISYQGIGCLLMGPTGSGKSRLAQEAMMVGAHLVADDQVIPVRMAGMVGVTPAPGLVGVMEIRGLGLIKVSDALPRQVLHLVAVLDPSADDRLPEPQVMELLGVALPMVRIPPWPKTSAAALLLYLRALHQGLVLPTDWRPSASA